MGSRNQHANASIDDTTIVSTRIRIASQPNCLVLSHECINYNTMDLSYPESLLKYRYLGPVVHWQQVRLGPLEYLSRTVAP